MISLVGDVPCGWELGAERYPWQWWALPALGATLVLVATLTVAAISAALIAAVLPGRPSHDRSS